MRIGIAGINGRMGRMLVNAIRASAETLIGGIDRTAGSTDAPLFGDIGTLAAACDVVIDFTRADSVTSHAAAMAKIGTAWVLGTTGLDQVAQASVEAAAGAIAIVQAANFSTGVTVLLELAERMGQALPAVAYDAEILDMHHRQKLDAPSGTAMALGTAVARGRAVALMDVARTNRVGVRSDGEIGFAALRGGQIVGEHTLSFTSASEQILLTHRAFDRAVFADGAVRAAQWVNAKPPGLYGMRDVLGF